MKNIDYEEVFKMKRLEWQNDIICIREAPKEFIFGLDPNNAGDGYIDAKAFNNDFISVVIYINIEISYERKVRVLFHEYGHALHYLKTGRNEIQRLKDMNNYDWEVLTEIEAINYCLLESFKMHNKGYKEFLKNTIKEIESEKNQIYVDALAKIKKEDLWQQTQTLINNILHE